VPGDKTLFTGGYPVQGCASHHLAGSGFQLDRSASSPARHGHRDRRARSRSLDR
jgi:hypothetical protein